MWTESQSPIADLEKAMELLSKYKDPDIPPRRSLYSELMQPPKIEPYSMVFGAPIRILEPNKIIGGYFERGVWKKMNFWEMIMGQIKGTLPDTFEGISDYYTMQESPFVLLIFPPPYDGRSEVGL